jgi:multidrug efflux pump subunit AcrA (membrane-fusion protein)
MDIKAILAKAAKGETLTDEERTLLASYDPDKAANSAAAAARKKAEAELKEARDKVTELEQQISEAGSEGKTELEKLQKQVEKLTKSLADKDAAIAKAEAERKKGIRDGKIGKIAAGMKLMEGVDPDLVRMALDRAFAEVADDDLDVAEKTAPIIDGFVGKNKALIVGDKGGGSGTPPKDGAGGGSGSSDPMKMTAEQRQAELKKKGII